MNNNKTLCDILPYEEIPEVTRDYVDFLFNVADLGEGMSHLYSIEEQRINLHEKMIAEYGLRYEHLCGGTRTEAKGALK